MDNLPSEPSLLGTSGDFGSSRDSNNVRPARAGSNIIVGLLKALADPRIAKNAAEVLKVINASTKGAGAPSSDSSNRFSSAIDRARQLSTSNGFNNFMGGNFMGGFTGNAGPGGGPASGGAAAAGAGAQAIMGLGSAAMGAIDRRTDNMYGKSLSYDKLSVLYQQTQGITQNQFANRYIDPLMKHRLGQGGAATLLSLQAQTGLKANLNASSVSALQAATGYAYNTQDMSRMMATMGSAQVNNRMTMTMGTGMYGAGGKQNDMMSVIQQVVKSSGLTNARLASSAMQQGSVTRARLTSLGLPEDMQNMVLQYAQSNATFKKMGGKGMYDPSKEADRKLMGIEDNFSTQQQETERTRERRDAQFYKRQTDNYAQLEKNTQGLINAFAALEDKMSGAIGARMNMRNNKNLAIGKTILGGALMIGGVAAAATGVGAAATPYMMMAGAGLVGSGLSGFSGGGAGASEGRPGDPMPHIGDAMPQGKRGTGERKPTNASVNVHKSLSKLNPQFRTRVRRMLADNPGVGLSSGHRSDVEQRSLFTSRYTKTQEDTGIFWEGSYWKKNAGAVDAAPPGLSMHEIGLAADLTGDLAWVQQNASKYGLKTFAKDGEPWHIQAAELPDDRVAYEKAGAKWGFNGGRPMDKKTRVTGMTGKGAKAYAGTTGPSAPFDTSTGKGGASNSTRRGKTQFNINEVARLLYKTGFRGDDLAKAIAISYRESGWNAGAYNPDASTNDLSYGLFQINMEGSLGPSRRKTHKLKSNEDLYNPEKNAKIAYQMYLDNKFNQKRDPFHDWGPYKDPPKPAMYGRAGTMYPKAKIAAKEASNAPAGDPMPQSRASSQSVGGPTLVGGANITIAPNITVMGGGGGVDSQKIAQEAAKIIERELKLAMMRRN
jgi:hypothetical protein